MGFSSHLCHLNLLFGVFELIECIDFCCPGVAPFASTAVVCPPSCCVGVSVVFRSLSLRSSAADCSSVPIRILFSPPQVSRAECRLHSAAVSVSASMRRQVASRSCVSGVASQSPESHSTFVTITCSADAWRLTIRIVLPVACVVSCLVVIMSKKLTGECKSVAHAPAQLTAAEVDPCRFPHQPHRRIC
jgi:hypothetical protein